MIELSVTHPEHPQDAAAAGAELLERASINALRNGDLISISNDVRFRAAVALLRQAGFEVLNASSYTD